MRVGRLFFVVLLQWWHPPRFLASAEKFLPFRREQLLAEHRSSNGGSNNNDTHTTHEEPCGSVHGDPPLPLRRGRARGRGELRCGAWTSLCRARTTYTTWTTTASHGARPWRSTSARSGCRSPAPLCPTWSTAWHGRTAWCTATRPTCSGRTCRWRTRPSLAPASWCRAPLTRRRCPVWARRTGCCCRLLLLLRRYTTPTLFTPCGTSACTRTCPRPIRTRLRSVHWHLVEVRGSLSVNK